MHITRILAIALAASACAAPPAPPTGAPSVPASQPLASLDRHNVVPAPATVLAGSGAPFVITAATAIVVDAGNPDAARTADMLGNLIRPASGFALPVTTSAASRGYIALRLNGPASLGAEGYALDITTDSVRITANAPAGLFHGVQTFRQLLPAGAEAQQSVHRIVSAWTVPAGHITDRPRFEWRGAMLDVSRHFFTVDEVKQFIDILALYKLNVLHLHLADDQGWRIQVDARPKLTAVGGSTQVGGGQGGFYTKPDFAELVRYAQERYITVVPEIDMPGHTNAAIAAYPELSCSKPTPEVNSNRRADGTYTGIRVGWSTFCPDSEATYRFVDDVWRELAAMTPGRYLHIGGDEVHQLTPAQYNKFVERTQDIVAKYGKTMIGWEEIGSARLKPGTLAQKWKTDTSALAQRQGAKLIMSPAGKTYLDMKYGKGTELGLEWAGIVDLRTTYDWDPAAYLKGVTESSVIGVEAPLWSETVQNITAAQYLVVPRLPAIAEVGWSAQSSRGWDDFRRRIAAHAPRWRLLGINYFASPQVAW